MFKRLFYGLALALWGLTVVFYFHIAWAQDSSQRDSSPALAYHYNPQSGTCVNHEHQIGYNDFQLEQVEGTRVAECMNLSGLVLISLKAGFNAGEVPEFGYSRLENWNFRGANLTDAELFFNSIIDADLRGAHLDQIRYGYASITGARDDFTTLPVTGRCEVSGDWLNCQL